MICAAFTPVSLSHCASVLLHKHKTGRKYRPEKHFPATTAKMLRDAAASPDLAAALAALAGYACFAKFARPDAEGMQRHDAGTRQKKEVGRELDLAVGVGFRRAGRSWAEDVCAQRRRLRATGSACSADAVAT